MDVRSCRLNTNLDHRYNTLPDDDHQPQVTEATLKELGDILIKHNMQHMFGVHLVHGHSTLPPGTAMIGQYTDRGVWSHPTTIDQADLTNLHGHIYVLNKDDKLVAYEYRQGLRKDLAAVSSDFLADFFGFLVDHKLTQLLGLEVRQLEHEHPNVFEIVFSNGHTLMLPAERTKNVHPSRCTGWTFASVAGVTELQGSQAHSKTIQGPHKVFIGGKLDPKLADLVDVLEKKDIL